MMITIRYNFNKDSYKLFYKPAPYQYIIINWFLENTHTKKKQKQKKKREHIIQYDMLSVTWVY